MTRLIFPCTSYFDRLLRPQTFLGRGPTFPKRFPPDRVRPRENESSRSGCSFFCDDALDRVSSGLTPGGKAPGQQGGWLGREFDPFLVGDPNRPDFHIPGCSLPPDLSGDRLHSRQSLLSQLDQAGKIEGRSEWNELTDRAVKLILSPETNHAFDLSREPDSVRERYGRNTHGQCVLLARRLIESGVSLVTVNWHDDGQNFWDTHGNNFIQLRDRLMPTADLAFSALLEDLEQRGLLEETLVVWVGEFGRRPQITRNVAGREHWARCYSGVLAGGGIRGGSVSVPPTESEPFQVSTR